MIDIQEYVVLCVEGKITHEDFVLGCSKLIKAYANRWWNRIGQADGRDYEDKEQLCTIWCWETIQKYDLDKGRFTTLFYKHCDNRVINLIKQGNRLKEKANTYSNCYSYEFQLYDNKENEKKNKKTQQVDCYVESRYNNVEMELVLEKCGFDELTVNIIKCKIQDPKTSCASIASQLSYSRAYISMLWNKAIPVILRELEVSV